MYCQSCQGAKSTRSGKGGSPTSLFSMKEKPFIMAFPNSFIIHNERTAQNSISKDVFIAKTATNDQLKRQIKYALF